MRRVMTLTRGPFSAGRRFSPPSEVSSPRTGLPQLRSPGFEGVESEGRESRRASAGRTNLPSVRDSGFEGSRANDRAHDRALNEEAHRGNPRLR